MKAIVTHQRIPAYQSGLRFEMGPFLRAWQPLQMLAALRKPCGPMVVAFRICRWLRLGR